MRYFLVVFLFLSQLCSAQKNYGFDHRLEYEYIKSKNSLPEKRIVYTNSKADNYYLMVKPSNGISQLIFLDYNGITSSFTVNSEDFIKKSQVNLDCGIVFPLENPYKNKIREHHIIRGRDTLLNEKTLQVYILKNQKERKEKRQNLVRHHYVIEKDTEYYKPIPLFHLAYEENKKENSLPHGIFKLMYNVNYTRDTTEIYRLKDISHISKTISFDKDCSHLK